MLRYDMNHFLRQFIQSTTTEAYPSLLEQHYIIENILYAIVVDGGGTRAHGQRAVYIEMCQLTFASKPFREFLANATQYTHIHYSVKNFPLNRIAKSLENVCVCGCVPFTCLPLLPAPIAQPYMYM